MAGGLGAKRILALAAAWALVACDAATRPVGGVSLVASPPGPADAPLAAGALGPSSYAPGMGQALRALPSEGGSVAPLGQRSLGDRPDEVEGFSVHGLYVLPADAPDEGLDTSGALAASLQAQGAWLAAQSGGSRLRLDTFQGQPDLSFYRSRLSASALRAEGKLFSRLMQELDAAGFNHPLKGYAIAYGGEVGQACTPGATVKLGEATPGRAVVFLKACAEGQLGGRAEQAQKLDLVLLHEVLHALGFVGECAPHHREGSHTQDDPQDLMAAIVGAEAKLDPGRDDYFQHGRAGCPDLALSPFLEPLPKAPAWPKDRPWVASPLAKAQAFQPSLQAPPGLQAAEAALRTVVRSQRQAAGQPALAEDPKLNAVAREAARRQLAKQSPDLAALGAAAGSVGALGASYFSLGAQAGETEWRAALAKLNQAWWKAGSARRWGVGVVGSGPQAVAALVHSTNPLDLVGASWGEHPQGGVSLSLRLRALGAPSVPFLRAKGDASLQVFPTRLREAGPTDVHFSFPADGQAHEVAVLLDPGGDPQASGQVRSLPEAFKLSLDLRRPLASALRLAPN